MNKTTKKTTIIVVLVIVAAVGYFAYLQHREKKKDAEESYTAIQTVLSIDWQQHYPGTPKEVVKAYNEILRCYYNESCTDEELEQLGLKARELYDAELLENNEEADYLANLKSDVESARENKRKITSISVASAANTDYFEKDGYSFARIACGYSISENGDKHPTKITYLLRQDEKKKWKIYGWDLSDNVSPGQE